MAVQTKYTRAVETGDIRPLMSLSLPSLPNTYNRYNNYYNNFASSDQQKQIINSMGSWSINPMYLSNTKNSLAYNSLADVIFNRAAQEKRWDGTWLDPDNDWMLGIPLVARLIADTGLLAKNTVIDPIVGSIELANRDATDNFTWWDGLSSGLATAGINTLVNFGNTLDIVANPIKGLVFEGPKGFVKGLIGDRHGRKQYDAADYIDNPIASFAAEIALDPLNWISFGTAGAAKAGVKTAAEAGTKTVVKELGNELAEAGLKTVTKEIVEEGSEQALKIGTKWVLNNGDDAVGFVAKRLKVDDDVAKKFIKGITTDGAVDMNKVSKLADYTYTYERQALKEFYKAKRLDQQTIDNIVEQFGKSNKYTKIANKMNDSLGSLAPSLVVKQLPSAVSAVPKNIRVLRNLSNIDNKFTKYAFYAIGATSPIAAPVVLSAKGISSAFTKAALKRAKNLSTISDFMSGITGVDLDSGKAVIEVIDDTGDVVKELDAAKIKAVDTRLINAYSDISEPFSTAVKNGDFKTAQKLLNDFNDRLSKIIKQSTPYATIDEYLGAIKNTPELKSVYDNLDRLSRFANTTIDDAYQKQFVTALAKKQKAIFDSIEEGSQDANIKNDLQRYITITTGKQLVDNLDETAKQTMYQFSTIDFNRIDDFLRNLDTADLTEIGSDFNTAYIRELREDISELIDSQDLYKTEGTKINLEQAQEAIDLYKDVQVRLERLANQYGEATPKLPKLDQTRKLVLDNLLKTNYNEVLDVYEGYVKGVRTREDLTQTLLKHGVISAHGDDVTERQLRSLVDGVISKLDADLIERDYIRTWNKDELETYLKQTLPKYVKYDPKEIQTEFAGLVKALPELSDLSKFDSVSNIYKYIDEGYVEYVFMRSRGHVTDEITSLKIFEVLLNDYDNPKSAMRMILDDPNFADNPIVITFKENLERVRAFRNLREDFTETVRATLVAQGWDEFNAVFCARRAWDSTLTSLENINSFDDSVITNTLQDILAKTDMSINASADLPSANMDHLLNKFGIDLTGAHTALADINHWYALALKEDSPFSELFKLKTKGKSILLLDTETTSTSLINAEIFQIAVKRIDPDGTVTEKLYKIHVKSTVPDETFFKKMNSPDASLDNWLIEYRNPENKELYSSVAAALRDINQNIIGADADKMVLCGHNIKQFDLPLLEKLGKEAYAENFAKLYKTNEVFDSYNDVLRSYFNNQLKEETDLIFNLKQLFSNTKYAAITHRKTGGKVWGFLDTNNLSELKKLLETQRTAKSFTDTPNVETGVIDKRLLEDIGTQLMSKEEAAKITEELGEGTEGTTTYKKFNTYEFRADLRTIAEAKSANDPAVIAFKEKYSEAVFERAVIAYVADLPVDLSYETAHNIFKEIDDAGLITSYYTVFEGWEKAHPDLYRVYNMLLDTADDANTVTTKRANKLVPVMNPNLSPNGKRNWDVHRFEIVKGKHGPRRVERYYKIVAYDYKALGGVDAKQDWLSLWNKFKEYAKPERPHNIDTVSTKYPDTFQGWQDLMKAETKIDKREPVIGYTIVNDYKTAIPQANEFYNNLEDAIKDIKKVWHHTKLDVNGQTIRLSTNQMTEQGINIMRLLNKGVFYQDGMMLNVKRIRDTSFINYFDVDAIADTYAQFAKEHGDIPTAVISELTRISKVIASQRERLPRSVADELYQDALKFIKQVQDTTIKNANLTKFQALNANYFKYLNKAILTDSVNAVAIARTYINVFGDSVDPSLIKRLKDTDAVIQHLKEVSNIKADADMIVESACTDAVEQMAETADQAVKEIKRVFEDEDLFNAFDLGVHATVKNFTEPFNEFQTVFKNLTAEERIAEMKALQRCDDLLTEAQEQLYLDPDMFLKHLPFTKTGYLVVSADSTADVLKKVNRFTKRAEEFVVSAPQLYPDGSGVYIAVAVTPDAWEAAMKQIDPAVKAFYEAGAQTKVVSSMLDATQKATIGLRKRLASCYKNMGYSTGDAVTKDMVRQVEAMFGADATKIVTVDFLENQKVFTGYLADNMIVGNNKLHRHFNMYYSTNSLFRIQNTFTNDVVPKMTAQAKFLNLFCNSETSLKNPVFKNLEAKHWFELVKHKDSGVCFIVPRKARGDKALVDEATGKAISTGALEATQSGIVVDVIKPKSVSDMEKLLELNAHVIPVEYAPDIIKSVNDYVLPRWAEFLRQVSLGYKLGYLGSLGWPVRNVIDSYFKNLVENHVDGVVPIGRQTGTFLEAEKLLRRYNTVMTRHGATEKLSIKTVDDFKVLQDMFDMSEDAFKKKYLRELVAPATNLSSKSRKVFNNMKHKQDLANMFLSLDDTTKALLKKNMIDTDMFELVHNFILHGPSSGLSNKVAEYFYASAKTADDVVESTKGLNSLNKAVLEHTPVKYVFSANQHIEQAARFNLYLSELQRGGSISTATRKVIETHFDYSDKSLAMLYIETIFPFMSFSFKNLTYWADRMLNMPKLTRVVSDCLKSVMDYNSLFEEDYEAFNNFDYGYDQQEWGKVSQPWQLINAARLYHLLQGNIVWDTGKDVAHDSGYGERMTDLYSVFKLSPSVLDAYTLLTRPLDSLEQRMLPPVKMLWNTVSDTLANDGDLASAIQQQSLLTNLPGVGPTIQRIGLTGDGWKHNSVKQRVDDAGFYQAISSVFGAFYVPQKERTTIYGADFEYLTSLPQYAYYNNQYYREGGFNTNYYATRIYSDPYNTSNPTYRIHKLARNTKPRDLYSRSKRHKTLNNYSDLFRNQLTFNQLKYRTIDKYYYL